MTGRWPAHPRPGPGEALTSWLTRLARANLTNVDCLLRHDLGLSDLVATCHDLDARDLAAPGLLLRELSARTGVAVGRIRAMTIEGRVPWLVDGLDGEPAPGVAFDTYLGQGSVLFTYQKNPASGIAGWRAWLPYRPSYPGQLMARGCSMCAAEASDGLPAVPLIFRIPVTVTCPRHMCRLQPVRDGRGSPITLDTDIPASPAPPAVLAMDARTHRGVAEGIVDMPRRTVHLGVWLRLLRTLIDELGESPSSLGARDRRTLQAVWQQVGNPPRPSGVYEDLPWASQQVLLQAAAAALTMAEEGRIAARGTRAPLLTPEPVSPFSPYPPDPLLAMGATVHRMTRDAQADPLLARDLLLHMTGPTPTPAAYKDSCRILADAGVPDAFLPRTAAELRDAIAAHSGTRPSRMDDLGERGACGDGGWPDE